MIQTAFSRDELIAHARGELFPNHVGRLPMPNMLMFDRITHIQSDGGDFGRGVVIAEMDVRPDLWFFGCHFVDDPVMPGCLGLDALWQLTGFFLTWLGEPGSGRALGVDKVRFSGQILPTSHLVRYVVHVKRIIHSKLTLIVSNGSVSIDDREIYTAEALRVALFTSTTGF